MLRAWHARGTAEAEAESGLRAGSLGQRLCRGNASLRGGGVSQPIVRAVVELRIWDLLRMHIASRRAKL